MNMSLPFSTIQGNAFNGIREKKIPLKSVDQADVSIFPFETLK